jgi:hypothetical protein
MFKNFFKKDIVTLNKYKPTFITVNGQEHTGVEYNWAIVERLKCSIPEYIMVDINSDGYIEDENKIMYPLANVVSIKWNLVGEMTVEDYFDEYSIFVSNSKIESVLNKLNKNKK